MEPAQGLREERKPDARRTPAARRPAPAGEPTATLLGPARPRAGLLLRLQRTHGNQYVQRMVRSALEEPRRRSRAPAAAPALPRPVVAAGIDQSPSAAIALEAAVPLAPAAATPLPAAKVRPAAPPETPSPVSARRNLTAARGRARGIQPVSLPAATLQRQPAPARRDVKFPEQFPTYEGWLEAFYRTFLATPEQQARHTFRSHDTARGVTRPRPPARPGGRGTRRPNEPGPPEAPAPTLDVVLGQRATPAEPGTPVVGRRRTDRFVDQATDAWVTAHLPERLRQTAYQLPSDCADLAVILRHVWVAAHGRSERFRGWTIGFHPGGLRQEQRRVGQVISAVSSGSVAGMLNPYKDASGNPLVRFRLLEPMLHPGDVLVWEHHAERQRPLHRTGGHTQTISHISRDSSGRIKELVVLQGNQPIGERQARQIQAEERAAGRPVPGEMELRHAPGRRIEVGTMRAGGMEGDLMRPSELEDSPAPVRRGSTGPPPMVWTWGDGHTRLIAAGPPAAAARPAARRRAGEARAVRRLSDWLPGLRSATRDNLQGRFEAALLEVRAMLEGGVAAGQAPVPDEDARALGQAAGEAFWRHARAVARSGGGGARGQRARLMDREHYQRLQQFLAVLAELRQGSRAPRVPPVFNAIRDEFVAGARGATTISFQRPGVAPGRLVKILLTGFDPFNAEQRGGPRPGEWNPAGAAVLALDGTRVVAGRRTAAVEGLVLPVSFRDFGAGMVERFVRPHVGAADAVITVSMSPNIAPDRPVRIERYAINAHELDSGELRVIQGAGAVIEPAAAPVEAIASATQRARRGGSPAVPAPTIGEDVTFRFANAADANRLRRALGIQRQAPTGLMDPFASEVTVGAPAITQIIPTLRRLAREPGLWVSLTAAGRRYEAEITSGPGGNYLSNEVSYRVLSMLRRRAAAGGPASFHVHTQRGGARQSIVPPEARSRQDREALALATQVRDNLLATLQQIIRAVVQQLPPARPGSR